MRLLSILGPPAYFSGHSVLTFLITRAANLSLKHGPSAYSAYAYAFYGALHNARTGEYDIGYAFGRLALALARRFANRAEESRTLEIFALLVHPWKGTLRESLPLLREGVRAGVESGELAYAAFNLDSILINGLPAGVPLSTLAADAEATIEFAQRHRNRTALEIALPFRQFARALMGETRAPGSFDDGEFEEERFLEQARDNHTALGNFWVARLQAACLFGDDETARRSAQVGERHVLAGILGMVPSAEHVFYAALTLARSCDAGDAAPPGPALDTLRTLHAKLSVWARHCPQNFEHKSTLVAAEIARLSREPGEAFKLYRSAIDGAARQRFLQDEALAYELRARFLLAANEQALAAVDMRAARDRYRQWGAPAKVRALESERPEWLTRATPAPERRMSIDAMALIKASQAISAETEPDLLFERILRVVAEVAGGRSGALLLAESGGLTVRARIDTAAGVAVTLAQAPLEACRDLPLTVLRYVVRTRAPLVLPDASTAGEFRADLAVRGRGLKSVLCVPLVQQARVIGLLYLENDALALAFADDLVNVVQVLAAQAVISLENAQLHQASRQELQQRRQAEQALGEANRRKDEFLAMLAHELRNPLAPISAAADLLQRASNDPARVQKSSAVIARQVRHMTGLVNDLLDVSRVTRGLVHLQLVPVDLHQTMRDAIEQVRPLIESRRHALTLHTSAGPAMVRADPKRLVQVLTNLLTNAAKYTPDGGRIQVELRVDDETVHLAVEDSGQGMSPELLDSCFDLFVQAERTSERAAGGLGIGLALVRSLVELHGGTVRAESGGAGLGSRFTVSLSRLPKPADVATPSAANGPAESAAADRLKVLIVDDNEDAAEMLGMLVEALGHDTVREHHPRQALARVAKEPPDVCLLDVGLPEMDGYELARAIRSQLGARPVTLVAVTGYGQPQDRDKALASGFDEHFPKPVNSSQLEQLLAAL